MLPNCAGGIFEAIWIASLRSRASMMIEARELLLGLGERAVGHRQLAVAHAHGGRGVHGVQRRAAEQVAAGAQLVAAGQAGFVGRGIPVFGREIDEAQVFHGGLLR